MIKNKEELLSSGDVEAKEIAVEIVEQAIRRASPYEIVKGRVRFDDRCLLVEGKRFELRGKVYVVGVGKAACPMAKALEELLGEKISGGVVVTKYGYKLPLRKVEVVEAGHPVPDENSLKGTEKALEIARKVREKDTLIVLVSGGGSSLFTMPEDGIELEDKVRVNELLLKSGAKIHEMNAVRKHISKVKGGKFVKGVRGRVVSLIISDVVGDSLETIASGITVRDPTTFHDAYKVLKLYSLWERIPESVRNHIALGMKGLKEETLKERLENVHNFLLCSSKKVCEFALERCKQLGYPANIVTTSLEGEARHVGKVIASVVQEIWKNDRPFEKPVVLIFGGETTVTMEGAHGKGGPNQELVLASASKISGLRGCCIVSVDTDGTDGPTEAAGGVVDSYSFELLRSKGIDAEEHIKCHNSFEALKAIGGLILTGPTMTNVNSLTIAVILGRVQKSLEKRPVVHP